MKVLALTEGPRHVCYRYRIEAFSSELARQDLQLTELPLQKGLRRLGPIMAARDADVVILQRKLLPIWQLALLRRRARRLIYDVDDAVFGRDSNSPKGPRSRQRMFRFWATVYASDAILTGNDYLRRRVCRFVEPERVHVIPTCVEPSLYPIATHETGPLDSSVIRNAGRPLRLVWIGQASTLESLTRATDQFAAIGRRVEDVEMRLICDRAAELPGVRVVLRRWSSATEADELARGDIGISWLPDDAWSRGKCGLKTLQYMAAGLPVIANSVGVNRHLVINGHTGLLAETPEGWAEAVARLAADPHLRRRLGAAGRQMVEQYYSVDGWAPRFADVVAAVARGNGAANPVRLAAADVAYPSAAR